VLSAAPRLPEPASSTDPATYVLCVAHDDPHKDLDGLAATFSVHADLPPLWIAGRCTTDRMRLLESRSHGRIRLLGEVKDLHRLARLYRDAVCVVAHSIFEAYGFSPAESLLNGTPVAATDIPAHREVCGEAAVYYPAGDGNALASAVRLACERPVDARAPSLALQRTWSQNAEELLAVLTAVGTARRRTRRARPSWLSLATSPG